MTAHAEQAATLIMGVLQRADDDRLEVKRVEQADPRARPWQPFAVDKQPTTKLRAACPARLRYRAPWWRRWFAGRGLGTALERFGAPQLSRRFSRAASRPITGADRAADVATKAVIQAAIGQPNALLSTQVSKALRRPDFTREGSKACASSNAHDRRRRRDRYRTGRRPHAS